MSSVLFTLALHGCSGTTAPPERASDAPAGTDLPHVVLVTFDTTRADRIGAYGYAAAHTPVLDGLAARGRRYARAYSPIPLTIPAHASVFTGQLPHRHGLRANGDGVLGDDARTLAEALQASGYRTAASVSAYVTTRKWGFSQGFDAYFDEIPEHASPWLSQRPASAVVDDLLEWRALQDGGPQFVWAHFYDPHFPYTPRPEWLAKTPDRPYDAEIAYADDQLGRLLAGFGDEPVLVVVFADHGEGLGEHGESTHGLFVWDTTQRVPWIMAGPGVEPAVVAEPVSLVDLAPTLLDALGLPPLRDTDGRATPGGPARPVYMESYQLTHRFGIAPHVAVVVGDEKLIALPRPEVYRVDDPGERANLAESVSLGPLQDALAAFGAKVPDPEQVQLDPSVVAQLEALGYLGGEPVHVEGELPDPKDHAELIALAQRVDRATQTGRLGDVVEVLEGLATRYPYITEFEERLVKALDHVGRHDEALARIRAMRSKDPGNPYLDHTEAIVLARMGRFREAAPLFANAATALPELPRVRAAWIHALVRSGEPQLAADIGGRELERHPDDYALAGELGLLLVRSGRKEKGIELLELGARASRPERDVCTQLAAVALGRRDLARSIELLERELRGWPDNQVARLTLIRLLGRDAANAQAVLVESERYLRIDPRVAEIHYWRAQALFNLDRLTESREAVTAGYAVDPKLPELMLLDANLLAKAGERDAGAKKAAEAQAEAERRASGQGERSTTTYDR